MDNSLPPPVLLTRPDAQPFPARSKHWKQDGLPCLRPSEEQMLPVFERWARVVELAEVSALGCNCAQSCSMQLPRCCRGTLVRPKHLC